jgi:hypothetical protein
VTKKLTMTRLLTYTTVRLGQRMGLATVEWRMSTDHVIIPAAVCMRVVRLFHLCRSSDLSPAWSFAKLYISRELRNIANIGRSGLPQCVSRPPSHIHSEGIADTPSIIMGNTIVMTLYNPIQPDNAESFLVRFSNFALGLHRIVHNDACFTRSAR